MRDGVTGVQMGTMKATMTLVGITTYVMRQTSVTFKTLQIVGRRWCRQVQLRRELSCCLDGLWRVMSQHMLPGTIQVASSMTSSLRATASMWFIGNVILQFQV